MFCGFQTHARPSGSQEGHGQVLQPAGSDAAARQADGATRRRVLCPRAAQPHHRPGDCDRGERGAAL